MSDWRRNLYAATAATFIGFTGFTLVMPFLPLYFEQLGVTDVGEISLWSGVSLGVTPAITAFLAPLWGRLADRYGRKIMVQRSLISFVLIMAAMAFVSRPWHVFALRAVQGIFAGYGALALTMAADSAPKEHTAYAIGFVQTAQRLGPALGPVIGGVVAQAVGLRRAFFVTAAFYALAAILMGIAYDERKGVKRAGEGDRTGRVSFKNILAFENFILLMVVVFGLQFVDRSFGPVLPLFVGELGANDRTVPLISGLLFSIAAGTAAFGNQLCGRFLQRHSARSVIATTCGAAGIGVAGFLLTSSAWWLALPTALFGAGIGAATTAAYTAATVVIPTAARGAGFGLLTTASLVGLAVSPIASGLLGATSIRAVFAVDAAILAALAILVKRLMITGPLPKAATPAPEEL
ncbi:MAG: MFS transporter [Acidobacteria bacterium]|nr:MFS transporter [Acidobacteriota bacterium]